jgi:type II secretory ATPase GspE/PulE/Tfp pilus assembly ATPase PilB-like protein
MPRFTTALLAAALALSTAPAVMAQDVWPNVPAESLGRGPGFYFAIWKLVLLLIPFWLWVKTADWLGRDAAIHGEKTGLKPEVWNPVYVFVFFFVFLLGLSIPIFLVGYLLVVLAYVVPLAIYVVQRNAKVAPDDRVFTPDHLKKWFANLGKRKKKGNERKRAPYEYGAPVDYTPQSGDKNLDQGNLIGARQSPAFVPGKELMADALNRRTEKILLDYTADAVAVKYMIDGVWHNATPKVHEKDPLNRELGDAILAVYKKLCNLNVADRRSRQEGKMQVSYQGVKYNATLASQGTQTGERVMITLLPIVKTSPTLEDLGMREPLREKLKEALATRGDLVVFSSMPGDGLSATWVAGLKACDRFTRDYVTIQDVAKAEPDVENVESSFKFNAAAGETPMKVLPQIILKQPEVFCVPEIADSETLNTLLSQLVEDERKAIVSIRAKEAVEAILRLLMLKPDVPKFATTLKAIVNQRLVRKLCDQCKEAFQPEPQVLQRLGIPAGRVQTLYREKQPLPPGVEPPKRKKGDPPEICPKCNGIGYHGRTAIYEVLIVDDKLREAIAKQPKIEVLRQVSRQAGNWSLQEEGILLLAQGVTSFTELQRVLKA